MTGDEARNHAHTSYEDKHPTRVELHAKAVARAFPLAVTSRTRDVIQMDIDGDRGCSVILTAEAAEIRLPTVEWTCGAYGPRTSTRFWKRRSFPRDRTYSRVLGLIKAAVAARKAEFLECRFCGREFPPEHRMGDRCHGCAEGQGVVF
jgi:hypothetical protein